jgi:hypothetical protein
MIAKIPLMLITLLSLSFACTLVNISVEPAVTQFYTAGFSITLADINSTNWKKDIDIFVLRGEDYIPIQEIYKDSNSQEHFSIPDNGNMTNGFFYVGNNFQLGKQYVFWVQACGTQQQADFEVVNQYGIGDQVGTLVMWLKNNILAIFIGIIILVLLILIMRPLITR